MCVTDWKDPESPRIVNMHREKKKDWKKYTRILTVVTSGLWDYGPHFVSSLSFLNIDYDKYLLSIMCHVLNDGVKVKR